MSGDNFTQKEILLQLMAEMRELRVVLNDHKELITKQSLLNQSRDNQLIEIKKEIDDIKRELEDIRGFKIKVLTVWAIGIGLATFLANRII